MASTLIILFWLDWCLTIILIPG